MSDSLIVPNCEVTIDEVSISEYGNVLSEVHLDSKNGVPVIARLHFSAQRESNGRWAIIDNEHILPWKKVDITATLPKGELQFSGYIITVEMSYDAPSPSVVLECQDASILLDREHVTKLWSTEKEQLADGDIVAEIAHKYGWNYEADSGITHTSLMQNETDIRFLQKRALALGYELRIKNETLFFKEPTYEKEEIPPITVECGDGTNCTSFQLSINGYSSDVVRGNYYKDNDAAPVESEVNVTKLGEVDVKEASKEIGPFNWLIKSRSDSSEALDKRVTAAAVRSSWGIRATGELDGMVYGYPLEAGTVVSVEGVGERNSGDYLVEHVVHRFSSVGYKQSFTLLRDALSQ